MANLLGAIARPMKKMPKLLPRNALSTTSTPYNGVDGSSVA